MRIDQVDLIAYGPFTGESLDLSGGREGLHVLYGPNEAGKSSTLRAILYFLYGIPAQRADNFLHENPDLRIGVTLSGNAGVLRAIRRKGNARTLRAADDTTPIDEAVLRRFLPVDSLERCKLMFGIDHERLIEGGRRLLEGEGEFGSMLFAASAGITNLPSVQTTLSSAAEGLYTQRSRSARIPVTLSEMRKAQERQQEAQTTPAEYKSRQEKRQEIERELAAVSQQLRTLRREQERVSRLQKALPWLSRRQQFRQALDPIQDAVLLPEDFALQYQAALSDLRREQTAAHDALARLTALEEEARKLPVDQAVLAQADLLKPLYEDLGAHRSGVQDRPRQEGKLASAEAEARQLLSRLRSDCPLDQIAQLQPSELQRRRIHALRGTWGELNQSYKDAWHQVQQTQRRLKEAEQELASLPPVRNEEGLLRALGRARQEGNLEAKARQWRSETARDAERLEREVCALPLWQGSAPQLEAASVPLGQTVERFERALQELERRYQQTAQKLEESATAHAQIEVDLQSRAGEQDVPTEGDLVVARQKRDQHWADIREGVLSINEIGTAYEQQVAHADVIGDRLRREARRVSEKARLLADRERLVALQVQLQSDLAALQQQEEAVQKEWREQWPNNIQPATPREMRDWLRKRDDLVSRWHAWRSKAEELAQLQDTIRAKRDELSHELRKLGEPEASPVESLTSLQQRAQAVVDAIGRETAKRNEVQFQIPWSTQDLLLQQEKMREAQAAREKWLADWEAALQPLGLSVETPPDDALAVLEILQRLSEKQRQIEDVRQRIAGIRSREDEYRQKVSALAAALAPDLKDAPPEQAILDLHGRLTAAQQNQLLRGRNLAAQQQQRQDLEKARQAAQEAETRLHVLCAQAQCGDSEGLGAAAERSNARRKWEALYRDAEDRLAEYSLGDLSALEREAAGIHGDELDGQLQEYKRQIDDLEQREKLLEKQLSAKEHEEKSLGKEGLASQAAEDYEAHQASLEQYVDEYVRLRTASLVLQESIRRYREKNQGPMLDRVGQLFRLLTNGSFRDVHLTWDERGEATLVGARGANGAEVHIEGMSEGTRDQLYLALRLASLEQYFETHEAAPFIVDDILINFDDQRSIATLKALAELSRKTQVLLFTHHEHLIELAERELPSEVLFTHFLRGAGLSRSLSRSSYL